MNSFLYVVTVNCNKLPVSLSSFIPRCSLTKGLMTEQKRLRVLYSFRCLFLNHIVFVVNRRPFKLHLILVFKGVAVTLASFSCSAVKRLDLSCSCVKLLVCEGTKPCNRSRSILSSIDVQEGTQFLECKKR